MKKLLLFFAISVTAQLLLAQMSSPALKILMQKRLPSQSEKGSWYVANEIREWNPSETAIIICDMWDHHWCKGAEGRVAEMALYMNDVVSIAREKGIFIVHAPSECMEFYKNHPGRKLAQKYKNEIPNALICRDFLTTEKDALWPIDQSDEGCDCAVECKVGPPWPWTRQIALLDISDKDAISDSGDEMEGLFKQKGIKNVILIGVHTNMCVIGRTFGLRNMVRLGLNVVLMRDMTDTMYDSKQWPFVNHFTGNGLVTEYIEKYVCPSILSSDFTGKKQFIFNEDPRSISKGAGLAQSTQSKKADQVYNLMYKSLSSKIERERIRKGVFYLSHDPLPRRVLNYSLPRHEKSTLEEADAWIIQQLTGAGYKPETDETKVRAFGRDLSKPIHHQYAKPPDDSPWFTACNIITTTRGKEFPDDIIVIIAHKDSQSWIASPGANDNAIGTCGALELAMILNNYKPKHTIRFIFCNEEHTPWTSVTAAEEIKASGVNVLAVINMDGIGVKPPEQKGHLTNVTRYTTPEGERLADMMADLNKFYKIGLEQSKYQSRQPGDDDGSFINAGFPWSVLNIGSMPYGDPEYHLEGDTAEKVDYENAALTVKLTLAAVLHLDTYGRP